MNTGPSNSKGSSTLMSIGVILSASLAGDFDANILAVKCLMVVLK